MADFRYYCDKHNMVYSCVHGADGKLFLACRKCLAEQQQNGVIVNGTMNNEPKKIQQKSQKKVAE